MRVIDDINIKNYSTVLLRLDLNMPLNDNGDVIDGARIDECIDTIKFLLLKNTKIVIISHFQRPGGKVDASMSLLRVKGFVEKKINKEVYFIDNINTAKQEVSLLSFGSIAMLENLRFFPEEELNDDEFAKKLASIGEVYVNDAFSCSHRKHASVHAITKFINSYAGLHLAKEVNALEKLFSVNNKKTNSINALCPDKENVIKSSVKMAIVGGKKISGKIDFINSMLGEMNCIMIGGAMANTFLAASGCDVGGSFFELDMIDMANDIMSNAKDKKTKIVLPIDFVGLSTNNVIETRSIDDSLKDFKIFDIGPKSIVNFAKKIYLANSIFWNGPLGLCEKVDFCIGTVSVGAAIGMSSLRGAQTIVGGGDTLAVIKENFFMLNRSIYSHVSTGGGALLDWISNRTLPCIDVLKN